MRAVLLAAVVLLAAACSRPIATAPDATGATTASAAPAAAAPAPARAAPVAATPRVAPPMSTPLPPEQVPANAPPKLDVSCRTDSDCAIKDVGSCCGAQPACVNRNSPTDPAAVKAQCQREGRMSVCGFKPIESCSCVAGACEGNLMMTN